LLESSAAVLTRSEPQTIVCTFSRVATVVFNWTSDAPNRPYDTAHVILPYLFGGNVFHDDRKPTDLLAKFSRRYFDEVRTRLPVASVPLLVS
jgi:hypothetical protein